MIISKSRLTNIVPTFILSLIVQAVASISLASESIIIELPNEHEFLSLRNVTIVEKNGRDALNGSVFKTRDKFMPWGSHLHIDLIELASDEEGSEKEILIDRIVYRFRRNDFDDSGRFERFFKYVDLSAPNIDKIVVEAFTQPHNKVCGQKEEETQPPKP